jgi:hypothetical protein
MHRTVCIYWTHGRELKSDCNSFFTSFVRSHKVICIFYLVFKTFLLKHLNMICFWSKHVLFT